jgi:hypothetical protein
MSIKAGGESDKMYSRLSLSWLSPSLPIKPIPPAVLGVTESVAQQSLRGMTVAPANKAGGKYKPFFLPYSNTSGIPRGRQERGEEQTCG